MAVGLGVAALDWGLVGTLLASGGALAYRTFSSVPGRSFWGHEDDLGVNGKSENSATYPPHRDLAAASTATPPVLDSGHRTTAMHIKKSSDGYYNWTPRCSRCSKQWPARDELAGDGRFLPRD